MALTAACRSTKVTRGSKSADGVANDKPGWTCLRPINECYGCRVVRYASSNRRDRDECDVDMDVRRSVSNGVGNITNTSGGGESESASAGNSRMPYMAERGNVLG